MKIAIPTESHDGERRVAASPDTVKAYVKKGLEVDVQAGAGAGSSISDDAFAAAGAKIVKEAGKDADIVLTVRRPSAKLLKAMKNDAILMGGLEPYGDKAGLEAIAKSGVTAFAMELMPRITRAQAMDILSSQANLAGYKAVIDAAAHFTRAFPMMMTAAGTVPPAKVFIMGVGVAGLQAIATARRLGAIVSATDVRKATEEQVKSLGAKFVFADVADAATSGGYAKELSAEDKAKQAALVADHVKGQDIVITTALIPGRPAPVLITKEMVEIDEARFGDRRSRGRARRQLPAVAAGRSRRPQRRVDRRHRQSRRQAGGQCLAALCQEPRQLPRPHGPEGRQPQDRRGRRMHQGHHDRQGRRAGACHVHGSEVMEQIAHSVDPFVSLFGIFVLAVFVGYYVVWNVTPALHTPLMSVTNAISSVIVVGALLAVGVGALASGSVVAMIFGFLALILASVNIFGGFMVTSRMLAMYKKKDK